MLRKIIAVKNVGRFRNSGASGNTQLAKHALVSGANGYGKTTLCSILRSLQTGDASHIQGRRTLGSSDDQYVEILLQSGTARFKDGAWSESLPLLAIFDGVFVADNVHSGEVVDLEQKRNLYRVIIGDMGVRLANEDAELAASSRAKTADVTSAGKALNPYLADGMTLESFIRLKADANIGELIAEQNLTLEAAKQATVITARAALSEYVVPSFAAGFTEVLTRSIENVAADAEQQLMKHLANHGMIDKGAEWIAAGTVHAASTCPYCGQSLEDLTLIAAYRAIFSDGYKELSRDILAMETAIAATLGDSALTRLETVAAQNAAGVEFWAKYCKLEESSLSLPAGLLDAGRKLRAEMSRLLEQKKRGPLEVVAVDAQFSDARMALEQAAQSLELINAAIKKSNVSIETQKMTASTANVRAVEAELKRREAIKTRHSSTIAPLCDAYMRLLVEKATIDERRARVRDDLKKHTSAVVEPYEKRINEHLDAFNAGFKITKTDHSFPAGIATASYQLVIDGKPIDVGDSNTPNSVPSFKNTLSAGDRTTLALAFFLADLERDPELAKRIVVFDDPFNSQDAFRRNQTVHEIVRIAGRCAQVIVLSHDATFLKRVWDKSPMSARAAVQITDHRSLGSKITELNLDEACQGRTATDMDDLQTYVSSGAGKPIDIIRKMRVVLETFCRTAYPGSFLPTEWLGDMIGKIRNSGDAHPAYALYDPLDQINSYTSQYHHGEDTSDATPDGIDPSELLGYAKRTLKIANALQA